MDEQPVRKPAYWAVLPAIVRYDPSLPDKAKLLYAEISALTGRTGFCYASNEWLCRILEMSDRTLQRNLRILHDRGFIEIRDGEGGSKTRKIFAGVNPFAAAWEGDDMMNTIPGHPPTKMSGPPDKNVGGTPDKNVGGIKNKKDQSTEKNRTPKAPKGASAPEYRPEIFERFWALYPIHKSRQSAVKAWDRLKPSDELMRTISKALKRQMATDEQWARGIGIPYAATYLNQRRWEDDILPDRSKAGTDQAPAGEVQREWI